MYTLNLTEDEIYEMLESLGDRKVEARILAEDYKKWGITNDLPKIVIAHCDTLTDKLITLLGEN